MEFKYYAVKTPVSGGNLLQCGNSSYMSPREAEMVYAACSEHIPVMLVGFNYGQPFVEVKRNY